MSRAIDLQGQHFGRLTVISLAPSRNGRRHWRCRCSCGTEVDVAAGNLKAGNSTSCGCRRDERIAELKPALRHGYTGTPTWNSWNSMIQRCSMPAWKHYHGRGITVCERWKTFENFLADMGERPPCTTLDRIDGDGNYEPGNCRWATHIVQLNNRRGFNRYLQFGGCVKTTAEWAAEMGITRHALFQRLKAGWSVERALTTPMKPDRRRKAQPA